MERIKNFSIAALLVCGLNADIFAQTSSTKDNYKGLWNNGDAWATSQPNPIDNQIDDAINVYGYITREGSLIFENNNNNKDFTVYDTLVVNADMTFGNKAMNLVVPQNGLLVILGNFTSQNKIVLENGGNIVVMGDMTFSGGVNQSSYTDNGGALYVDGTVSGNNDAVNEAQPIANLNGGAPEQQALYDFLTGTQASGTLPVQLLYFDAEFERGATTLTWATQSEENFDFFSIERSADGGAFEEIGTVKGAGWSQTHTNYSFTDANPLPGANYYRLKAVDFDGYTEYFPLVSVYNDAAAVKVDNLAQNHELGIQSNIAAKITILNMNGLPVFEHSIEPGISRLALPASLNSGCYIAIVHSESRAIEKEKIFVK